MGAECAYRRCQVRESECRFKSLYDRSFNQERCTFADWSISRSVGQTGGLRFLSIPDIIALNRLVISRSGFRSGSTSFVIKPEIIEYLVEAVQVSLFGIDHIATSESLVTTSKSTSSASKWRLPQAVFWFSWIRRASLSSVLLVSRTK